MRGATKTDDRLDALDAEEIDATLRTPGWALIACRYAHTITQKQKELEQDIDTVQTADVRGFIKGLRRAIEIPRIMINEAREPAREPRK